MMLIMMIMVMTMIIAAPLTRHKNSNDRKSGQTDGHSHKTRRILKYEEIILILRRLLNGSIVCSGVSEILIIHFFIEGGWEYPIKKFPNKQNKKIALCYCHYSTH